MVLFFRWVLPKVNISKKPLNTTSTAESTVLIQGLNLSEGGLLGGEWGCLVLVWGFFLK